MPGTIRLDNVSVRFVLQHQRPRSFQDVLVGLISPREPTVEEFWALRGVSFDIGHGETVGLVGQNGSGKSTILKLITRILEPTRGKISVSGRVSALIELGAGFHPDLTGRENIYLNGSILGLGRKQIDGLFNDIVTFSELERFIDTPVKHYSSGMYMRLGFSVATSVDPDILIIDEVLSVGDEAFQRKCLDRIFEFKRQGKTILFVSHGLQVVEQLCDRVIWLNHGIIQEQGPAARAIHGYMRELQLHDEEVREAERAVGPRTTQGSSVGLSAARAYIREVTLVDADGRERYSFRTGESLRVRVSFQIADRDADYAIDLELRRADGLLLRKLQSPPVKISNASPADEGMVELEIETLPLLSGSYDITPTVREAHESSIGLTLDDCQRCSFSVWSEQDHHGLIDFHCTWKQAPQSQGGSMHVPVGSALS